MKVDYFTIPEITVSYKDNVKPSQRAFVGCFEDVAKIFSVAFEDCMEHHEEVYALFLNGRNQVLGISCISKGGMSSAAVDIRIILQTALKVSASSIMLSHNHPSGGVIPSHEDLDLTLRLKNGCQAIGIKLLDHVIVSSETCASMAAEGFL
jgi:DNA repair protein RadC